MDDLDSAEIAAGRRSACLSAARRALDELHDELTRRGLGRELGGHVFAAETFLEFAAADDPKLMGCG